MKNNDINIIYHADLSDALEGETYWLHAMGKRHKLNPHTEETLARLRADAPHLCDMQNVQSTHFTHEPITLPADRVVRVHLKHTMNTLGKPDGHHGVSHAAIHSPHCLQRIQGASQDTYHASIDYVTTAKCLAFHHPDLINVDPQTTAQINKHMNDNQAISSEFDNLGAIFRQMGPATETSGWARLVAFAPDNGDKYDGSKTYYFHQPTEDSMTSAGPALTMLMKATKNDPSLEVKHNPQTNEWQGKWTQQSGQSVATEQSPEPLTELATLAATPSDNWTASLTNTNTVAGLDIKMEIIDASKKQLKVTFSNTFIRYLGAYIRFIDACGNPINTPDWKVDGLITEIINDVINPQYDDLRFMGLIGPVNNVMAIPIVSDPGVLEVIIEMPDKAVSATLWGSGLGTGGNPYPKTPLVGGVLTGVVNLGVPAFMLAFGAAAQSYKPLYDIIQKLSANKAFVAGVIAVGVTYFGANFGIAAANKKMDWKSFSTLAKLLFDKSATEALLWIEADLAAEEAAEEIPFAGWIILALNIATGIAQMAETIVEVATSPWNIPNSISSTITTTTTLHPDPRHKAWPQAPAGTKTSYTTKLMYKKSSRPTRVQTIDVPDDETALTLTNKFENNTLGGEIKLEVNYYFDNWLAGKATTGWLENDEDNAAEIMLYLVQYPIPLSEKSVYKHTAILDYEGGAYAWRLSATAPTTTVTSRNTSASGNAISQWYGMSLSQKFAKIGWAWRAAGTGLVSSISGQGGQLAVMNSMDIPGRPMDDAKFPTAGFSQQTQLMYDPYPPKFQMNEANNNWVIGADGNPVPDPTAVQLGEYYIDPRKADADLEQDGGYHLRKVDLSSDAPFDLSDNQLSYGRFPYFPTAFVLHPAGYALAVTNVNQINKLQIVPLVLEGAADDQVPMAATYAGEALNDTRHGLLFHPVAVSCSYDGTIIVLEDTKSSSGKSANVVARLQAFDLNGNPVSRFMDSSGDPSPFLILSDADNLTYLDVCAVGNEKMTYMYVLYYKDDGANASDYQMAIYQYGSQAPATNPLVSTPSVAAAKLAVDMWHTMYTLNYAMTTDSSGNPAGPQTGSTGPAGRTVPSISEWLPPIPTETSN